MPTQNISLSLSLLLSLCAACDLEPELLDGEISPRSFNQDDVESKIAACGVLTCGGAGNTSELISNERFYEFSLAAEPHVTTENHTIEFLGGYHPDFGLINAADIGVSDQGTLELAGALPEEAAGFQLRFDVDGEIRTVVVDDLIDSPFGYVYDLREATRDGSKPLCPVDPMGKSYAFLYPEIALYTQAVGDLPAGKLSHGESLIHVGCSASAMGKASIFGFRPTPSEPTTLGSFEGALRAVRLELCEVGVSQTAPGAMVILNDRAGVMHEPYDFVDLLEQEAAFDRNGAVCWNGVVREGATMPTCEEALALPHCDDYVAANPSAELVETYLVPGA